MGNDNNNNNLVVSQFMSLLLQPPLLEQYGRGDKHTQLFADDKHKPHYDNARPHTGFVAQQTFFRERGFVVVFGPGRGGL